MRILGEGRYKYNKYANEVFSLLSAIKRDVDESLGEVEKGSFENDPECNERWWKEWIRDLKTIEVDNILRSTANIMPENDEDYYED